MRKHCLHFCTDEKIKQIIFDNIYEKSMDETLNSDVTINHLENVFTDETYYSAMKIVPLLERKVLYLSYIENCKLNEICKRLKIQKNEVIKLRSKAIQHFKANLNVLSNAENSLKGDNFNEKKI